MSKTNSKAIALPLEIEKSSNHVAAVSVVDEPPAAKTDSLGVDRDRPSFVVRALKSCSVFWSSRPDLRTILLIGWVSGAALWLTIQIVRGVRFQRRVLRDAKPSSDLQQQSLQIATELGLRSVPRVLIIDATVSPMLWGCGSRAKLLFPAELAKRLDNNARATLLTHELAHFSRGDHWVRLLVRWTTTGRGRRRLDVERAR